MSENNTKIVYTKKFYLEVVRPITKPIINFPEGYHIKQLKNLDTESYLKMYSGIGEGYNWTDRVFMDKNELLQIINHEDVYIFGFYENDNFVGYCELDFRYKPKVEMVYFGLIPNYQGKGIGKQFLNAMLTIAFDLKPSPQKLWLTTCDLDHPSALNNYLKRGFTIFDEKIHAQRMLE